MKRVLLVVSIALCSFPLILGGCLGRYHVIADIEGDATPVSKGEEGESVSSQQ